MRRRRSPLSIVWLMALVAVLGIELTALITNSWLGDFLAFNVTTVVLIFAPSRDRPQSVVGAYLRSRLSGCRIVGGAAIRRHLE
jgi:hypothetical protein